MVVQTEKKHTTSVAPMRQIILHRITFILFFRCPSPMFERHMANDMTWGVFPLFLWLYYLIKTVGSSLNSSKNIYYTLQSISPIPICHSVSGENYKEKRPDFFLSFCVYFQWNFLIYHHPTSCGLVKFCIKWSRFKKKFNTINILLSKPKWLRR